MRADTIKDKVGIQKLLRHYGAEPPHGRGWGNWMPMRCPFHKDTNASASVNYAKSTFYCHGCDVHGDVIDIVQKVENLDFRGAKDWLERRFV